ncbi:MAG: pyridoxal-phosphate dependent enzyme, partial [Candidatus Marinimicrobia bacterium]|nr:pyridoxal-phosphate dependent enzyme [Candidatus Neomarinimicrobiota bacterium]
LKCIELSDKKSKKQGFFGPKQFKNTWNVFTHMNTTAPEFYEALKENKLPDLDVFVAGAGTGGTIMGFHHYFTNRKGFESFKAIPVFPMENSSKSHRIEGIGDSFIPEIMDLDILEPSLRVKDSDAINIARQINKKGLSVGISSGANVYAAIKMANENKDGSIIGTILCDGNKKYLSTDLCSYTEEKLSIDIEIKDFSRIA